MPADSSTSFIGKVKAKPRPRQRTKNSKWPFPEWLAAGGKPQSPCIDVGSIYHRREHPSVSVDPCSGVYAADHHVRSQKLDGGEALNQRAWIATIVLQILDRVETILRSYLDVER